MQAHNTYIKIDKNGLRNVSNIVSKIFERQVSTNEVRDIYNFIRHVSIDKIRGMNTVDTANTLARMYVTSINERLNEEKMVKHNDFRGFQLREISNMSTDENPFKFGTHHNRRGVPEVRESDDLNYANGVLNGNEEFDKKKVQAVLLKSQIKTNDTINKILNAESIDEIFRRFNPTSFDNINLPRQRILFDSRGRNLSCDDYKWDIYNISNVSQQGTVPIRDTLQQIAKIKIAPFWLPVPSGEINSQYYKKIRLLINEFEAQSTILSEFGDTRQTVSEHYHFEFDIVDSDGGRILLEPVKEYWVPNKIIAEVSSISFVFLSPNERIIFDRDRDTCTLSNTNPCIVTTTEPHKLSSGELVYFINLFSSNTSINHKINNRNGFYISVLTATTFEINADLTALAGAVTCDVFYASKRLQVQLDFVTLER